MYTIAPMRSTAKAVAIEIPTVSPSGGDVDGALLEACWEADPVDVGEALVADTIAVPCDVIVIVALGPSDILLVDMVYVAKLKPLTGIPKTVAAELITTVAVNALDWAWLLRYVKVWPLLTVDIH